MATILEIITSNSQMRARQVTEAATHNRRLARNEFLRKLRNHDWFFAYSDDGAVVRRVAAAEQQLKDTAKKYDWEQWFANYRTWVFDGKEGPEPQ